MLVVQGTLFGVLLDVVWYYTKAEVCFNVLMQQKRERTRRAGSLPKKFRRAGQCNVKSLFILRNAAGALHKGHRNRCSHSGYLYLLVCTCLRRHTQPKPKAQRRLTVWKRLSTRLKGMFVSA